MPTTRPHPPTPLEDALMEAITDVGRKTLAPTSEVLDALARLTGRMIRVAAVPESRLPLVLKLSAAAAAEATARIIAMEEPQIIDADERAKPVRYDA